MNHPLSYMPAGRLDARSPTSRVALVCLLIGIRLFAGAISETCFFDLEWQPVRTVHIHSAGEHDHCHHGRYNVPPLVAWACSACKDANEFTLPDSIRLPLLMSLFVPLFLLVASAGDRPLIAARGRGPPLLSF